MFLLYLFVFLFSCFLLFWIGKWMIKSLLRIAQFLEWREFVVSFLVMSFAATVPNFFVGISSALRGIPQLSFGDILGGNIVDLTIAVALATFIAGELPAGSKMVQTSSIFTIAIAILPIFLIFDGVLGRGDGLILIAAFFFYLYWLFSKKERFKKNYNNDKKEIIKEFKNFLKDIARVVLGICLLLLAAEGIVRSSLFFAQNFNLSIPLVGILIVGLGNAIPDVYFAVLSAKKGETWMILGDLMGTIILPASLVLGIVAFICPIKIYDFSPFAVARFFMIISAFFFLFCIRTGCKITKREAKVLLLIYVVFVIVEILTK